MTPRQRKPLPLSTEKKWEAATSRSMKRGPRTSAPGAAVAAADAPVVVTAAADSRMKITANRLASRANRAGDLTTPNNVGCGPGILRRPMSITFKKRQKEMKRQEKQRAKAERREQRKFAKRAAKEGQGTPTTPSSDTEQQPQSDNKQRVPPEWRDSGSDPCVTNNLVAGKNTDSGH